MKVKSLFLSMCAIAALASCSQNEDVAPADNAGEARVTLRLKGDGVGTRVGEEVSANEEGAKVKDVTVFFFNKSNLLVGTPQYETVADASAPIVLKTSTDAKQVVVVANLGKNETTATGVFKDVRSLEQLKGVVFSSITGGATNTVNQTKARLYMSGIGGVTLADDGVSGTATVNLHFLSARINKINITWKAGQNYGSASGFDGDDSKWWCITQVYLMMSQTNSQVLPAGISNATSAWSGSLISDPSKYAFAGGLEWGTAPWSPTPTPAPIQTDGYIVKTMPNATGNQIENVLASGDVINPWYVFENPSTTYPTGIIVEVKWRSIEGSTTPTDMLTRYFTLYFGEKKDASGNQPMLKPGETYDIALKLNGDFKPGGNGGGGTDDPAKPSVDASISVTVNAAKWTTAVMDKDFN